MDSLERGLSEIHTRALSESMNEPEKVKNDCNWRQVQFDQFQKACLTSGSLVRFSFGRRDHRRIQKLQLERAEEIASVASPLGKNTLIAKRLA